MATLLKMAILLVIANAYGLTTSFKVATKVAKTASGGW